jgi:hypothetical protein
MFRPNWPSSGLEVVTAKDSAAHCNAVFFPPIASGYFSYAYCHKFYLGVLGLHVVALGSFGLLVMATLNVLYWSGSSVVRWLAIIVLIGGKETALK